MRLSRAATLTGEGGAAHSFSAQGRPCLSGESAAYLGGYYHAIKMLAFVKLICEVILKVGVTWG